MSEAVDQSAPSMSAGTMNLSGAGDMLTQFAKSGTGLIIHWAITVILIIFIIVWLSAVYPVVLKDVSTGMTKIDVLERKVVALAAIAKIPPPASTPSSSSSVRLINLQKSEFDGDHVELRLGGKEPIKAKLEMRIHHNSSSITEDEAGNKCLLTKDDHKYPFGDIVRYKMMLALTVNCPGTKGADFDVAEYELPPLYAKRIPNNYYHGREMLIGNVSFYMGKTQHSQSKNGERPDGDRTMRMKSYDSAGDEVLTMIDMNQLYCTENGVTTDPKDAVYGLRVLNILLQAKGSEEWNALSNDVANCSLVEEPDSFDQL